MEIPEMMKMYAPISKVDEEHRMVYGYATSPTLDSQKETVDLEASFEAADEWKKWANIKEMHRPESAVGVAPVIEKHVGVGLYIGAEIVDDAAWKKVQKKVYKGFSIGGRVITRDGNRITKYKLLEVSLVDRPANPDCLLMVAKRDESEATPHISDGGNLGGSSMADELQKSEPPAVDVAKKEEIKDEGKSDIVKTDTPAAPPAPPSPPAEEMLSISKADFERQKSRLDELEKALIEKKSEEEAASAFIKMLDTLQPKIKKHYEEFKPEVVTENIEKSMKDEMNKMSIGELTGMMLKSASVKKE